MKTILVSAMLLSTSCAHGNIESSTKPESRELRDLYTGYELVLDRPPEAIGDIWYYQHSLQLLGTKFWLYKSMVYCRNKQLKSPESNQGFTWYHGTFDESGVATLTNSNETSLEMSISFPSDGRVRIGSVLYNRRDVSDNSRACP
jgi:hypothetical protein